MIRFLLNDTTIESSLPAGTVLLDLVRYHHHLKGTKIGCREGDCGACTILVGELVNDQLQYNSMTSCLMPIGNAAGKHIVTIEGINFPDSLNPIQEAMSSAGATQCGFCTPGFVMSLAGFCLSQKEPTLQQAVAAIDGNICRCTGYKSIERAAGKLVEIMKERNGETPAEFVSRRKILPAYFATIREKLAELQTLPPANGTQIPLVLGGGTDLYVQKPEEMTHADIRFLFNQAPLNGIRKEGNRFIIGPSATVTDLKESALIREAFPDFSRYAKLVSSTPIRNMATLAGNFVNASPIGDFTIFFLALDAQLVLNDGSCRRELPLRKFYRGYKQLDKSAGECIEQISFDWPRSDNKFNFEKVSKRTHLDIASVNSAIWIRMENNLIAEARLSAGGVGPVPLFLEKTSAFLRSKEISENLLQETIEIMHSEISPISDARGTKEYKRFLLGQLIGAHFLELFPDRVTEALLNNRSFVS